MKRFMSFVNGVVTAFLIMVILGVGFVALTARRTPDGIPAFDGYRALSVISGSMEPAIHTGDVIIIRPVTRMEEIADGDVITFRVREKPEMLITHRVTGTVKVNDVPQAFTTKGDANNTEDMAVVTFDQIVGRYEYRLPYFGYVSSFIRKPIGILLVVILPGLMLIAMEFRKIWQTLSDSEAARRPMDRFGKGD